MPATSKQSLIVTGKPSRGRATRASELAAARQADAASFCTNRVQGRIEALHGGKSRKIRRSSAGKFPATRRRVHIGGGIEQMRHGWLAQNGLVIWRFSRK